MVSVPCPTWVRDCPHPSRTHLPISGRALKAECATAARSDACCAPRQRSKREWKKTRVPHSRKRARSMRIRRISSRCARPFSSAAPWRLPRAGARVLDVRQFSHCRPWWFSWRPSLCGRQPTTSLKRFPFQRRPRNPRLLQRRPRNPHLPRRPRSQSRRNR
jgi:hypothetical protein